MNDNPSAPRRRWFRFGLRTMFVVLTLFSILFGSQVQWVVQRRAFIADQRTKMRQMGLDANPYKMPNNKVRAPGGVWLIGESGVAKMFFVYEKGHRGRDIRRAQSLFPETTIVAELEWSPRRRKIDVNMAPASPAIRP